jgi:hypothetical protein
MEKRKDAVS